MEGGDDPGGPESHAKPQEQSNDARCPTCMAFITMVSTWQHHDKHRGKQGSFFLF